MMASKRLISVLAVVSVVALCGTMARAADEPTTNSIGMKFQLIPAGSFMMGSEMETNEMPIRKVTLTKPFHMGATEVTQAQYTKVMGANPSEFKGDDFPVDNVTWDDAQAFCKKLSGMDAKGSYRLPTEAEWEYACRGGTKTAYYWGDKFKEEMAWMKKNSKDKGPRAVGTLKPNPWGLYDMSGNVWEWCQDYHASSYTGAKSVDPTGPLEGEERVIRGSSWHFHTGSSRSANRHHREPERGEGDTGFRVVFVPAK